MKNVYSIMILDEMHLEEICQDIKEQYENEVAECVLFMFQLVPEGIPYVNKAQILGEKYQLFRDRLKEMNIECGILVQCSIGHGYPLDEYAEFQRYVKLDDGGIASAYCPYDEGFRNYIREQFSILASLNPKVIMVDDDFRLMYREGKGCACPLHMKAFQNLTGVEIERQDLMNILRGGHEKSKEYTDMYVETQRQALLGGARAMREGIDSVDPTIPGIFCSVGHTTEFAGEIAKILAGENHPVVVRINNGNYTANGARNISKFAFRIAQQSEMLKHDVDIILAETDTCPQNRYSTGAQMLHSHFVLSILEGANGAKHWLTRLGQFEPNSGKAYRNKLAKYSGFYRKLADMVPNLKWFGCRIPLPTIPDYGFTHPGFYFLESPWSTCVLERFGLPLYFSAEASGATFLEEGMVDCLTDNEIEKMFHGIVFLSADAASLLNARGFSEYIGVDVKPWSFANPSFEKLFVNGEKCSAQVGIRELVPTKKEVLADSMVYHLENGKKEVPLCPGTTVYDNPSGGRTVVFSGTPNTNYTFWEAFSFLNESRKAQFIRLLKDRNQLPIYYTEDAEVYMKAANMSDGSIFCAIFNMGFDVLEEIPLASERNVTEIYRLNEKGEFVSCDFSVEDGITRVLNPAYTLEPVILKIF